MKSREFRLRTGIPNLDEMLEGGFPAGSLITLAGRPGTGKTIFGSEFLYHGADRFGDKGIYVSMLEGREAYLRNMIHLGLDFRRLEEKGLFKFLEIPTLRAEGLPTVWEEIVRNLVGREVDRLVIDSFTAMAQTFESVGDLRVFTRMLLGKIVGEEGCTTLLITETPPQSAQGPVPGGGIEEFIADGVIHFNVRPVAGDARFRYIEIAKMRGTNHWMGPIPIEIGSSGITIQHPHIRGPIAREE